MKEDLERLRRRIILTMALLPFLIASLVVGGVFLGFYIAELMGSRKALFYPLTFATIGLAISLLLSFFIAKKASGESGRRIKESTNPE